MQTEFSPDETLYRALKPTPIYWKEDGTISSAAFLDSHGASVDRLGGRLDKEAVDAMRKNWPECGIISVTYQNCQEVDAVVEYKPTDDNQYHSEIRRSTSIPTLTRGQCKRLIKEAIIKLRPTNAS